MTEEGPSGLALLITAMQILLTAILQNLVWGLHLQFISYLLCFVKGTCSEMSWAKLGKCSTGESTENTEAKCGKTAQEERSLTLSRMFPHWLLHKIAG